MTVAAERTRRSRLEGFDLLIAALMAALAGGTGEGVHRTTLLALLQALSDAVLAEVGRSPSVDRLRAQLADALVSLRTREMARLSDDGFHLTDAGQQAVEQERHNGGAELVNQAELLVGQQSQQWNLVSPEPQG